MEKLVYDGSICEKCGRRLLKGEGRRLTLSNDILTEILRHYLSEYPKFSQKKYCEQNDIGIGVYNRIIRLKYKHPKDREKVLSAAKQCGYEFKSGKWVEL